ncbi:unnamed protein product [Effrenium voratum]|uniref:Uncharacterized protein n=1 Tax=Effrenium voratum TaxID=2562239 RepID=A0AA36IYK2_9DINO|nr:unnamed protein product [Effrenium voratum]
MKPVPSSACGSEKSRRADGAVWGKAFNQLDETTQRRLREEEKQTERRLWAEAVEQVESESPRRALFNLFDLLNDGGQHTQGQQMAAQEAKALQEHHEAHAKDKDVDPDSLLGKLMKKGGDVDQNAGEVNPNQNRPETFNEDTEAKKAAMAELLKKGDHLSKEARDGSGSG